MKLLMSVMLVSLLSTSAANATLMVIDKFFYVSTKGNDAWSGTLEKPNRARTDGPFASLTRARDAMRAYLKTAPTNAVAHTSIQSGTYYLGQPLALTEQDSGAIFAGEGRNVTISGGRLITGFKPVEVNGRKMVAALIPEVREGKWNFTQLFVNGQRRSRTRLPKEGFHQIDSLIDVTEATPWSTGQDKFKFKDGEIKASWRNLSDVDIVGLQFWVESRMPVKSVDEAARTVLLGKKSVYRMTRDHTLTGGNYAIENVFEALDTRGQWYLDRPTGTLYYYPLVGETAKNMTVIAPRLERLVTIKGRAADGGSARGITFHNIRFAHTEFTLPADQSGFGQAAWGVPGAIYLENARECRFTNCDISHIGNYAIEFAAGCRGCSVRESAMVDLGAGGVKIHGGSESTTIEDCDIGDGGKIFASAIGVWIGDSPSNRIANNNIHDLYYTGVSCGWTWGYGATKTHDNIIENNHIHDIGKYVLSDMGGIYHLGTDPGTKLRGNLIHDVYSATYGGWGIYTDEGSTDVTIENNVVYRTKTGGFHQHYGKENTVRNNIFAFAKEHQLQRSREEEHSSFTFERNIVYYDEGVLLGSTWANDHFKMDYNLYYDASGKPVTFVNATLDEWRKRGHDEHSLIADPLFVDPKKGDFTLKPDSPAFKLGFKPIKLNAGPRKPVGPLTPK